MIVVCTIVEENMVHMGGAGRCFFSCPWQFGYEANGYDIQSISTSIRFIP